MDFNSRKYSYRQSVEDSLSFAGQGLDFYTRVKAEAIGRILMQDGMVSPNLLDIGCGHGFIHPMLTNLGCKVVGVETATEVLPLSRAANPAVEYIDYDGHSLPFDDKTFDVVLAICVMHHVPPSQWRSFLTEAKRVLRPSGRVIVFEHNPLNPLTRYVVSHNEIDADAVLLSHTQLASILRESGYRVVQSRFILFTPFSHSFFRRAEMFIDWLPLGAQYYVTATA